MAVREILTSDMKKCSCEKRAQRSAAQSWARNAELLLVVHWCCSTSVSPRFMGLKVKPPTITRCHFSCIKKRLWQRLMFVPSSFSIVEQHCTMFVNSKFFSDLNFMKIYFRLNKIWIFAHKITTLFDHFWCENTNFIYFKMNFHDVTSGFGSKIIFGEKLRIFEQCALKIQLSLHPDFSLSENGNIIVQKIFDWTLNPWVWLFMRVAQLWALLP